jgi:hypothetical protein
MQVGNQSFGDLIIEIGSWNFFSVCAKTVDTKLIFECPNHARQNVLRPYMQCRR